MKNSLSAYLRKVRAGHSVVVYDRDILIARIDRIADGGADDDRLALLAARGITRPPEAERSAKRLRQVLLRPLARAVCLLDAVSKSAAKDADASIMRFWDSSALISLLIDEPVHEVLMVRLDEDPQLLVWWGISLERVSALARREREGSASPTDLARAYSGIRLLALAWHEILPSEIIARTAELLLQMHPLRASGSLPLASVLVASGHDASTLDFVCLDERLSAAARREGFAVIAGSVARSGDRILWGSEVGANNSAGYEGQSRSTRRGFPRGCAARPLVPRTPWRVRSTQWPQPVCPPGSVPTPLPVRPVSPQRGSDIGWY